MYENWKKAVRAMAPPYDPWGGPLEVYITLFEWRRDADLDNYAKGILDALRGIFWVDDNVTVICKLTVTLAPKIEGDETGFRLEVHQL